MKSPARPNRLATPLAVTIVAAAVVVRPPPASGQTVLRIAEDDACAACSIDVELVVTLQPPSDRLGFTVLPIPGILRDREGRYVAGIMVGDAPIAVFDPSGALSHGFGRLGEGPGEFAEGPGPVMMVGGDDTVHVVQFATHSVLGPGAREFIRRRQLALRPWCATIVVGTMVACSPVQAPGGRGTPLQVLAEDGRVARGIGFQPDRPIDFTHTLDRSRRVARAAGDDAVWSARRIEYEMSRFSLDGQEQVRVVRDAPWFPPQDEDYENGEGYLTPQRPWIEALREPTEGTLWVVTSRGDRSYEPPELPPGAEGVEIDPYEDDNGRLDTVIEVLDVAQGRLLARAELDPYLRFVDTPDDELLLFSLRTLPAGDVVVDIWRARLRRP